MGVMNKMMGPFGKWTTAKVLTIHDKRLGALYWILRIGVVVFVLMNIFQAGAYNYVVTPVGTPSFWFESGNLYSAQDKAQPYCSSSEYDYQYSEDKSNYWNDRDIQCEALHYGQIVSKSASSGFVVTYVKQEESSSRPCVQSENTCPSAMWTAPNFAQNKDMTESWVTRNSKIRGPQGKGHTCTCARLENYFVHGPEAIELHIEHSFLGLLKNGQDHVKGSSTYEGEGDDDEKSKGLRKNIKTCLRKKGMEEGECFIEFEPGTTMNLPLAKWMELAGVSLDERLTDTVRQDHTTRAFPYRRQVGVSLQIRLEYNGDVDKDDTFTCNVEVDHQDGWTSIGSEFLFANYQSQQQMEFYDRYRRGVQVTFAAIGKITQFDYVTMMNTVIQGLVLLGVVEHVIKIVAQFALPESPQYAKAMQDNYKHKHSLAAFGVNVALACQAFKTWDTAGSGYISQEELKAVFRHSFDEELSNQFVEIVMDVAKEVGDDSEKGVAGATCEDLVHLISSGCVSIAELKQYEAKVNQLKKYEAKVKRKQETKVTPNSEK